MKGMKGFVPSGGHTVSRITQGNLAGEAGKCCTTGFQEAQEVQIEPESAMEVFFQINL